MEKKESFNRSGNTAQENRVPAHPEFKAIF